MLDLAITATKESLPMTMSGTDTVVKNITKEMSAIVQPLQSVQSAKFSAHSASIPIQEQTVVPKVDSKSTTEKTDRLVRTARPASAASSRSSVSSRH
jgi:hypothetical protein